MSPPITDGWDSITQVSYKVAPKEARVVLGIARSKGGVAYVMLVDGPVPALQRRGAQLSQLLGSQRVEGLEKESFAGKKAAPLDNARAEKLAAFIEDVREKTRVPGAAVAIVQNGKIVFERGFGVRRAGKKPKVTPDTAFMIGSTTKSLTSLMMASLVEQGVFSWSTPLQDVLPTFQLADKEVAERVEMRHSVCACTGLPRQDMEFLFQFKGMTPNGRLKELATMKPTTGFGETFQYSNALVSAGGYAAAHAKWPKKPLRVAYEQAMRENVFAPLGMSATTFSSKKVARGNHARPHGANVDGTYSEMPLAYEDAVLSVAPAGGAWSTVRDLAQYVQLELAKGALPGGKRLVSEKHLLERRVPQVRIGEHSAYGLALFLTDRAGLQSAGHDGNTLGFSTLLTFWPEHNLGIVVLSNAQGANTFTGLVERKLIEVLFAGEEKADTALGFFLQRREETLARELPKLTNPPEVQWIKPLVGKYEKPSPRTAFPSSQGQGL